VPQFVAGQERYWAPHAGRVPGSRTPLPYLAPADHIFDLERGLGRNKDVQEFGPNVPIREYSFLANPRTPNAVKSSALIVELCDADAVDSGAPAAADCSDGSAAAPVRKGVVRIRAGLNDVQLRAALGDAVRGYRVVRFRSMLGAFSRHAEEGDHERFVKRTKIMTSIWCCVQPPPGRPGHVWYDMWWDTVPHKDLHGRVWNMTWHIVTGP
jgi:arabinosyltransferase